MTESLCLFIFMKEKGRNKEEKRNLDLILGSGRNKEEDFYGRRFDLVGGELEKCGIMEDRLNL